MKFLRKALLQTLTPLVFTAGILILLVIPSKNLSKNSIPETPKVTQSQVHTETNENQVKAAESKDDASSVDVKINNSTNLTQNTTSTSSEGTCTVIRNGKTETVPAGSVNVNEKTSSGGSIDVTVDCKNSVNSKSQVEIHTSTSN